MDCSRITSDMLEPSLTRWIEANTPEISDDEQKLHAFLFLYRAFLEAERRTSAPTLPESSDTIADDSKASIAAFLTSCLNDNELSELKNRLKEDTELCKHLLCMYPSEMIKDSVVKHAGTKNFVFSAKDAASLRTSHETILAGVSDDEDLHNPVFVKLDENGRLLID